MIRLLLPLLLLISGTAYATDYYVGPTVAGAGTCLTSAANNCLFATAYALVSAGDTINMADGTYQGANSMITCSSKSGSNGSPITVVATNPGMVEIDGQDARTPIDLNNCSWWVFEGLASHSSNTGALKVRGGSSNNIFRMGVAWDGNPIDNRHVVEVFDFGTNNNLFEDYAAWGSGRKVWSITAGPSDTTLRRIYGQWNYYEEQASNPNITIDPCYDSVNTIIEDSFFDWDMTPGSDNDEPYGTIGWGGNADGNCYLTIRRTVFFVRSDATFTSVPRLATPCCGDEVLFEDVVFYLPPEFDDLELINIACCTNGEPYNYDLTSVSLIGGTGSAISANVTQTNVFSGALPANVYTGMETIYNADDEANICSDGPIFTGTSDTFPVDAISTIHGGPLVTAWLESVFGTVDPDCGAGATPPDPPTITMVRPTASTLAPYGGPLTIEWQIEGDMIGTGSICYVINGQEYTIATGVDLTDETYTWSAVTSPVMTGAVVRVKTTSACDENAGGAGDAQDDSEAFTIKSGGGSTL